MANVLENRLNVGNVYNQYLNGAGAYEGHKGPVHWKAAPDIDSDPGSKANSAPP